MPEELRYWQIGAKAPTVRVDIPEGLTKEEEFQMRMATRNLAQIALSMRGEVEPVLRTELKLTRTSEAIENNGRH